MANESEIADILSRIIADKRLEVAAAKQRRSLESIQAALATAPAPRDFHRALCTEGVRVIAECKRQSPSRGVMVDPYDPVALAGAYEAGGAAAISVLTDAKYFGGSLADLTKVRDAVELPVLRKDFIIDAYQIYEARAAGADTYLLLAGVLDAAALRDLIAVGRGLGMEPLVESHTATELEIAHTAGSKILGINNRDLKTFSIDLGHAARLLETARGSDPERIVVCESGIRSRSDVETMASVGYKCFLIGEALATHTDPQSALQDLVKSR